jgi:hypothetical protein
MNPTQEIIKAFDEEIINKGLPYLNLQQANKLLVVNGLMTVNEKSKQQLKKLIEEGNIQHAYLTVKSPKQWRIPLSKEGDESLKEILQGKKGKKLELKTRMAILKRQGFDTNCPRCYQEIKLSHSELGDKRLVCTNCFNNFRNPYREKYKSYIDGDDQAFNASEFQNQKSGKKKKKVSLSTILTVSAIVLITVFIVVQSFKDDDQNWNDPGLNKSNTGQLVKELRNTFEGRAVTPSTEQALYNKVGGMYPGPQKGPKYYSYDFLEYPISMTIINENGQRYYLMFQRGGVKKGDPRLKL